jgi:hypothetical protein
MFIIEGEEYFGKSLAADKLKEAVEEIGFRYIDVKQSFKNFKGPMKDQVERLAFTSQHDGLFLVGSKVSESEKIFSFLFNTESIALAIAQSKEAMQEFNKLHKDTQAEIISIDADIARITLEIDYYLKLYYALIIKEFQEVGQQRDEYQKTLTIVDELLAKASSFTGLVDGINWLRQAKESIDNLANKALRNTRELNTIEEILSKIELYNRLNSLIELASQKLKLSNQLEKINELLPRYQSIESIDYFIDLMNKKISLENRLHLTDVMREDLDNEYQLQTCSCCDGLGVHPL